MIKVKDLVEKYGEYEIDFTEIEELLVKPKPKSVWDLKRGDECFYMFGDGEINQGEISSHDEYRDLGMTALTEQELIDFREWLKIRAELLKLGGRESFKSNDGNWLVYYDRVDKKVKFGYFTFSQHALIYFDTKEKAENAVKKIGEDRLKKYWFKVADDETD